MPADNSWQISAPQVLDFEEPVDELQVRVVNGTVNVVGTEGPGSRVEITEVNGPPLQVKREGPVLSVVYEDLPWKGFLKWLDRKGRHRGAVVSVSVPAGTRLTVGVVGASAVVSGITGRTEVRGVSGGATLVGLTGPVRADTVSGDVETQGLTGGLRFNSVSGDLTVLDGGGDGVRADSVSGSMIVDLAPGDGAAPPTDVHLTTVSGEVALRLPEPVDAEVEVNTASGAFSSAFDELRPSARWGGTHLTGTLRTGRGKIKATTVSGSVALLRRPADPDSPDSPAPAPEAPSFSKDV